MGYLNTEPVSERINEAFKQSPTRSMHAFIESIMNDSAALKKERTEVHGGPLSVEDARIQIEMKVEHVFYTLYYDESIETVRPEDDLTLSDSWSEDVEL